MSSRRLWVFLIGLGGIIPAFLTTPQRAFAAAEEPSGLLLVDEGKPVATIVLREGIEGPLRSAAEALRTYEPISSR